MYPYFVSIPKSYLVSSKNIVKKNNFNNEKDKDT